MIINCPLFDSMLLMVTPALSVAVVNGSGPVNDALNEELATQLGSFTVYVLCI